MSDFDSMKVYLGFPKDTYDMVGPYNSKNQILALFPFAKNIRFYGHGSTEDHLSFKIPSFIGEKIIGNEYKLYDVHGNLVSKKLLLFNHVKMFIRIGSENPMEQLIKHFPDAVYPKIFYNTSGINHAVFWLYYKKASQLVGKRYKFNNNGQTLYNKLNYFK